VRRRFRHLTGALALALVLAGLAAVVAAEPRRTTGCGSSRAVAAGRDRSTRGA